MSLVKLLINELENVGRDQNSKIRLELRRLA